MSADDQAIQGALDALTDDGPFDWDDAESRTTDEETRRTLRSLRLLSRIASTHQLPDGATWETAIEAPFEWGPLHVLRLVGRGAYGDVYLARDPRLDRPVALKLLRYREEHREALESAAIEEGRLLARVRHPNVVTVHGAERIDGRVGIWMEFIDGRTLEDELRKRGPFDIKEVVRIGVDLCGALHAVHHAGLLHRDLKAQNIMRDREGRVLVTDLGSGRELISSQEGSRALAGTPLYLAPEIFAGAQPTVQSDLYSVAVLLFYLLTARYPTEARTLQTIRTSHTRQEEERDVRSIRPDVPRHLARVIGRGLAPESSARFETAGAMAAALQPPESKTIRATLRWSAAGLLAAMTIWLIATNSGRRLVTAISGAWHASDAARLSAAPASRQLELPQTMLYGNGLSYDGRYFSFAALDGSLAVFDMSSGQTTTSRPPDSEGLASFSIMSPDGAWVAYEWFQTPERSEVRIIGRTGLSDHALLQDSRADEATPVEWSRDGARILLLLTKDGSRRLALAEVATGVHHVVHEFRGGQPLGMSLSKDGRYIAYDWPAKPPSPRRELHVVAIDGSGGHRLLGPRDSSDRFPLWTPDGRHLFFISDRSGTSEGWLVRVQDGTAIDEPRLVVRNLGRTSSLGISAGGAYYYRLQTDAFEVYEVDLDPATMAPTGKPRPVPSRVSGSNIGPSYAPDGRHLSFISVGDDGVLAQATKVIVVRDLQTAIERQIAPTINLDVTPPPAWSPDGRQLLVRGTDPQANQWGVFILDAATGATGFRLTGPRTDMTEYAWACWTSDGAAILFEHAKRGIVRRLIGGDSETVVVPYPRIPQVQRIQRFGMDRTGRRLAFSARIAKGSTIMIVEPDGTARELIRTTMPESSAFQGWSANDEDIVFTRFRTGPPQPHELWRVPVAGGAPERVGLAIRGGTARNPVALGPRGDSLAYTEGGPVFQLWMMERFLPK